MQRSRLRNAGFLIVSIIAAAGAIALLVLAPWWLLLGLVVALALWMLVTRVGRQAWSVT